MVIEKKSVSLPIKKGTRIQFFVAKQ